MKDSIINGTGNSRYLKSVENFKALYPTYDDFAAALSAGTLPVDLNGINPAGFQTIGTPQNMATFLKDDTAALYGFTEDQIPDAVPDDVLAAIKQLLDSNEALAESKAQIQYGSYTGTGVATNVKLTFTGIPRLVAIHGVSAQSGTYLTIVLLNGCSSAAVSGYAGGGSLMVFAFTNITWSNKTVSWSSANTDYAGMAANAAGETYRYLAIIE